jgi:hypothetical protein
MTYNFTVTLKPYGDAPDLGVVKIDPQALYGYWEHRDGTEGGGLWFETVSEDTVELIDYDGDYDLPRSVVRALLAAGYHTDEPFTA